MRFFELNIPYRFLFLFIFLFSFRTESSAQNDQLKINLERIKNSRLKVTYIPFEDSPALPIKFRKYSRLCYFPLLKHKFISRPKAYNSKNERIKVVFDGERYTPVGPVSFWEYYLDLDKFPGYINMPLQTRIENRRSAYLYPSLYYPVPDGDDLQHRISIRDNISDDSIVIYHSDFNGYLSIDEFSYTAVRDQIKHTDSSSKFTIKTIGRFKGIENAELEGICKNLITAFEKTTKSQLPDDFQFTFIEVEDKKFEKQNLPLSSVFENSITVFVNASEDEYFRKENIIRNLMWQLFRWISPLHSHDKSWEKLDPRSGNHSIHLWYYESVTEYLSLICLIQNKLISESYFTQIIQQKVSKSIDDQSYSLIQLGTDFSSQSGILQIKKNLKVYDILTNRGVVSAMLMDIVMLNESNGHFGLMNKFLKVHEMFEVNSFPTDSFLGIFAQGHSKELKIVIEKYIIGIDPFHLKSYFDLIDWQFFRKGEEQRSFMKRGHLTYFPEIEKYVCTKAGKNTVGMEKGDIILSINNHNQISTMDLNEIILPSNNRRNENRVKVEILRNGKEMVLRGKAEYKAKVKDDIIIPLFNPNTEGYQLRKAMLH